LPEEADHDDGSDQYELEYDPASSPGTELRDLSQG
jgi:hypothetical protein